MSRKICLPDPNNLAFRYTSGESENSLAKSLNVDRQVIRRHLLESGITPRNQSQAEAVKWRRMTIEQRRRQYAAAHAMARGREISHAERCRRAKARENSLTYNVSPAEIELSHWLTDMDIPVTHNLAIGTYSCDLGIASIAVEIWGGNWHPKAAETERTKYILDSGYSILIIRVDRRTPLTRAVCQHVITLLELACANPAAPRQYWMIRGNGELIFKRFNDDNISLIPPFTSGRNPANGQYRRIPR